MLASLTVYRCYAVLLMRRMAVVCIESSSSFNGNRLTFQERMMYSKKYLVSILENISLFFLREDISWSYFYPQRH